MEVLAALLGPFAAPISLAAGIVLQWQFPGDFGYTLEAGGPAWATWIAVVGSIAAFCVGLKHARSRTASAAFASALVLLPTYLHGLANWSPSSVRPASPLTPGLVTALKENVPAGAIVASDPETSYRIAATIPVYLCTAPPGHVADTTKNRPYERREDWLRFVQTADLSIPRACGAGWIVTDARSFETRLPLPVVYRDGRYTLYSVPT